MTRTHYIAMLLPIAFTATITWFGVFTMVNAYLVKGLGYTDAQWASAILWLNAGIVFWLLLVGGIASRFGRRRTIAGSFVLAGVGFGVIAFTHRLWLIGPMLALMAGVQAAAGVAFVSLLSRHSGGRPVRAMAIYQWIIAALTVCSLIVGGYFMEAGHFRATFVGLSVTILVCAAAFYRLSRPLAAFDTDKIVGIFSLGRADWRLFGGAQYMVPLLLGLGGEAWYFVMVNQLVPNVARGHFGMSESAIGWIVALGRLPGLLSLYLLTHIDKKLNLPLVYGASICFAAVASFVIGWSPVAWLMIVAYFCYFIGQGAVWGLNVTTLRSAVPERLGEPALALAVLMQMGDALLMGALQRTLLDHGVTLRAIFMGSATMGLLSGIGLVIYARRNPPRDHAEPPREAVPIAD